MARKKRKGKTKSKTRTKKVTIEPAIEGDDDSDFDFGPPLKKRKLLSSSEERSYFAIGKPRRKSVEQTLLSSKPIATLRISSTVKNFKCCDVQECAKNELQIKSKSIPVFCNSDDVSMVFDWSCSPAERPECVSLRLLEGDRFHISKHEVNEGETFKIKSNKLGVQYFMLYCDDMQIPISNVLPIYIKDVDEPLPRFMQQNVRLYSLPPFLQEKILLCLKPKDFGNLAITSQHGHHLFSHSLNKNLGFWKKMLTRDHKNSPVFTQIALQQMKQRRYGWTPIDINYKEAYFRPQRTYVPQFFGRLSGFGR